MVTYWVLYLYVVATTVVCSANKRLMPYSMKQTFLVLLIIVLILFSGFRGAQVDVDSSNYIDWFQGLNEVDGNDFFSLKDPAFYIIGNTVSSLGLGILYLFLTYALVALWSKFLFIKYVAYAKYAQYFLYLYFCRFYFVHDMTQIRTGAAVGLASLALISLYRKYNYLSIATFILAITFHFSVVLLLPFFILLHFKYRFESRLPLLLILCIAGIVNLYFDSFIDIFGLNNFIRIAVYFDGSYDVKAISLFSVYFLVKVILLLYIVFFQWRSLEYFDRLVVYLVIVGLFFQVALMNNDALALRAAEVFSVFDLILFIIPFIFLSLKSKYPRVAYSVFIFLIGGVFFISSLKIMGPYELGSS
jgi:hypothetical protein